MNPTAATCVPVAIIGMGCLFPRAAGTGEFWRNIVAGVDAITEVPASHWRLEDYFHPDRSTPDHTYARRGGFLDPVDFPPMEFGITPNSLEATDTTQLLALVVAKQALEDAGYGPGRDFDRNRASVILGVTGTLPLVIPLGARLGHPIWRKALRNAGVPDDVAEQVVAEIADEYVGWQEDSFPGLLGNVVAVRIANRLNLGGTNCVVDAACASSLGALHLAVLELAAGRCDLVLGGGMDTFNDIFMYMCFSKTPALSPTGDARPFDAKGDGTILGEGLGAVVLKRLADAERDGDRIYAVIRAVGTSSDGKGNAIYAPSPAGQVKALRQAYQLAGITPDTVELVEAHGTGTRAGDTAEVTALTEVYRDACASGTWCALGSVKSQIGHTKAAAGAAGLIKAALALHHKVLPPTIKVEQPIETLAPGQSPFYLNREKRPWLPRGAHPRRAGVSSFGFGGSNYHCVLEEYRPEKAEMDWDGDVQIVALSAASKDELQREAAAWLTSAPWEETRRRAAASRERFRAADPHRLVFVLRRGTATDSLRTQIAAALSSGSAPSAAKDVCYGTGPAAGKLAFLFPGQGSQYVGMLRDVACQFPQVFESLREGAAAFAALHGTHAAELGDRIYPHSIYDDDDRMRCEEALRATQAAQPAIGALSLGLLRLLGHFNVYPDATAGHSFGELTALHAAGRLSAADFLRLAVLRGKLMAEASGGAGGMLAVQADAGELMRLLEAQAIGAVLANHNSPSQAVISGASAEIERAAALLDERQIVYRRLPVGAAFHSPLVADVVGPFREALRGVPFTAAAVPVFANSTGQPYPADAAECADLLANQLAQPVRFVEVIENLFAVGVRTFVEVGPGNVLTGLLPAILQGRSFAAAALDASRGRQPGQADLARALALLAAAGHAVDLRRWDEPARRLPPATPKAALTVPLCGANYRSPRKSKPPRPAPLSGGEAVAEQPVSPIGGGRHEAAAPCAASSVPQQPEHPAPLFPEESVSQPENLIAQAIAALGKIAEQTADLHRQFLEGQDRALQMLQSILQQEPPHARTAAATTPALLRELSANGAAHRQPSTQPPAAALAAPVETTQRVPAVLDSPPQTAPRADGKELLLEIVAEKTGYPAEMLQLDMEMDADLGIDSIKRVEILSALQEKLPGAPAIPSEQLGKLRTLRDVADLLAGSTAAGPCEAAGTPAANGHAATTHTPPYAGDEEPLAEVLLRVVSDKTGYPAEMLQLDMEMDADLGIDSIKRVEILSALQEQMPDLPPVPGEQLGGLRTLRDVLNHLGAARPQRVACGERPATNGQPTAVAGNSGATVVQLQRYAVEPVPLNPDGRQQLRLAPGARVLIVGGDESLAVRVAERFILLGHTVLRLTPDVAAAAPLPDGLSAAVLIAPQTGTTDADVLRYFQVLRKLGPILRDTATPGSKCLVAVSRLGGRFGLAGSAVADPLSAGLVGLVKTAAWEWPEVHCKAIDVAADTDPDEVSPAVVAEALTVGPPEVGVTADGLLTLALREAAANALGEAPIGKDDVVLVTGGARGVTAAAALELARRFAPTLVLLGRSPLDAHEPAWLAGLHTEPEIKHALARQPGAGGPREVAEQCRLILAQRAARRNLAEMRAAGATVEYRQLDIRDATAVRRVCAEVRAAFGPVRGLVHGAGVLADRKIEDKTDEQFRAVYETKVVGLRHLLSAAGDTLRLLALFSSSTGRFGRAGQADYAAANEVLNKLAQAQARRRPGCRVVSFNWGPWEGGMVTPGLKKLFAEEGLSLIPLDAGAKFFVEEIGRAGGSVEIVVLGEGSRLPAANLAERAGAPAEPNVGECRAGTQGHELACAFRLELDLDNFPALQSHVLGGRAVVPVVLLMEWFAHAALHTLPGLQFLGMDGLRVCRGVKLDEGERYPVEVHTGKAVRCDGLYRVPVELRGAGSVLHAGATVLLGDRLPPAPNAALPAGLWSYDTPLSSVYADLLFHGPDFHALQSIEGISPRGIVGGVRSAPAPRDWLRQPLRPSWLSDPLAVDGALQLLVLWTRWRHGMASLPAFFERYRQFRRAFPADGCRIAATVTHEAGSRVTADIDFLDSAGAVVARIDGYECVMDRSLADSFRRNRLAALPVR